MGENCGSLYERRQPDFAMEKTSVQKIWGNNGKEFSNFLEDVSQSTQRHLSYNHNSDTFVSHNMIQLLSRDQPGRVSAFPKCGYDGLSGTWVASSDGSHSSSGVTSGNFTVPQVALPNPPLNTSYLGTCQSKKRYQKESNSNEIREFRSLEEDCHPARCGRKGWCCTPSFFLPLYITMFHIFIHIHI